MRDTDGQLSQVEMPNLLPRNKKQVCSGLRGKQTGYARVVKSLSGGELLSSLLHPIKF